MAKKKSKKKVTKKKVAEIDPAVRKEWLAKVKEEGYALEDAPKNLKSDPKIVLAAVKQAGYALEYASKDMKSNPKIVLAAVKQDGDALEFASHPSTSDPKIVLAAVNQNGMMLEYASKDLQGDPKIALAAVEQDGDALRYASEGLRSDSKFMLAAVKAAPEYNLMHYAESMWSDPEVVLAVVKQDGSDLQYASKGLRNDPKIVLAALEESYDGSELQFAGKKLRSDPKIVDVALSKSRDAINYADDSYFANPIIVVEDVRSNETNLDFNSVGFKIGIEEDLGLPVKCSASYGPVCSSDKEDGVFVGIGKESVDVKGYIIWTETTWGDLIWELPKSTEDCIDAIEQKDWIWFDEENHPNIGWNWSSIAFDECTFGEGGSDGKSSETVAYEDIDVSEYEDFQCDDFNIIERSGSSYPDTITIEYDGGFKIELTSNRDVKWTGKFNMDSTTVLIGILKYENVLKVVRHCLEEVNPKNTFDSIIAKLLELNS